MEIEYTVEKGYREKLQDTFTLSVMPSPLKSLPIPDHLSSSTLIFRSILQNVTSIQSKPK